MSHLPSRRHQIDTGKEGTLLIAQSPLYKTAIFSCGRLERKLIYLHYHAPNHTKWALYLFSHWSNVLMCLRLPGSMTEHYGIRHKFPVLKSTREEVTCIVTTTRVLPLPSAPPSAHAVFVLRKVWKSYGLQKAAATVTSAEKAEDCLFRPIIHDCVSLSHSTFVTQTKRATRKAEKLWLGWKKDDTKDTRLLLWGSLFWRFLVLEYMSENSENLSTMSKTTLRSYFDAI